LVGLVANASFDATRGRTVRFLSSVLFTSIRLNAYVSWVGCRWGDTVGGEVSRLTVPT
jgi:hypothetical protein